MVAPPLAYGSSGEHQGFAGTLSIGRDATELVLVELGRSASVDFATGGRWSRTHGGNAGPPWAGPWPGWPPRGVRCRPGHPPWAGDLHAGRTETSLMLAIAPERVRLERAETGDPRPHRHELLPAPATGGVRGGQRQRGPRRPDRGARPTKGDRCWPPPSTISSAIGASDWQTVSTREVTAMNRVAVVTGAARGIGAATVRGLAAAGWSVVAVDRAGDDPRLPYAMGTAEELDAVVGSALAPPSGGAVGAPDIAARGRPRGRHHRPRGPGRRGGRAPRSASVVSTP